MVVYAIRDLATSPWHPLGAFLDTFIRRDDAERFMEDVRRDDPLCAFCLRVVPIELNPGRRT